MEQNFIFPLKSLNATCNRHLITLVFFKLILSDDWVGRQCKQDVYREFRRHLQQSSYHVSVFQINFIGWFVVDNVSKMSKKNVHVFEIPGSISIKEY